MHNYGLFTLPTPKFNSVFIRGYQIDGCVFKSGLNFVFRSDNWFDKSIKGYIKF